MSDDEEEHQTQTQWMCLTFNEKARVNWQADLSLQPHAKHSWFYEETVFNSKLVILKLLYKYPFEQMSSLTW